jgi:hypothetical protein
LLHWGDLIQINSMRQKSPIQGPPQRAQSAKCEAEDDRGSDFESCKLGDQSFGDLFENYHSSSSTAHLPQPASHRLDSHLRLLENPAKPAEGDLDGHFQRIERHHDDDAGFHD